MIGNRRTFRILALSLLSVVMGSAIALAQSALPPYSARTWARLQGAPAALSQALSYPAPKVPKVAAGTVVGPWTSVTALPTAGVNPGNPLLMTDGTVIVHLTTLNTAVCPFFEGTQGWFQLTPDINGNYATGTWSRFASLPVIGGDPYAPIFFASQVLPDGRVIINGGEYNGNDNCGGGTWTSKGAIYYPSLGAWTPVAPPAGWVTMTSPTNPGIGDAQSVVLDDGTYLLANCCQNGSTGGPYLAALFSGMPPFNSSAWSATGTGKSDAYDEEGWTLLPSGNVLTVDAYVSGGCDTNSEIYNATTGNWSSAGSTIVQLPDCSGFLSNELGPQALRPDFAANGSGDNVIAFGGTTQGTSHTAIYNTVAGTWTAGPNVPSLGGTQYTLADAPAATLPSGNVLFAASPNWTGPEGTPGAFPPPTNFWEVGPNSGSNVVTAVTQNPDGPGINSFQWNFLVLPTGQVLAVETYGPNVWIYNPLAGAPDSHWLPVINTSPIDVHRAFTYGLTGTQFGGLTQGAVYGDDVQANTNFPIVKIVNNATNHVFYERTSGFTVSVARNAASSTNFTVSGKTETGPSTLYVIANGISSAGVPVTVH